MESERSVVDLVGEGWPDGNSRDKSIWRNEVGFTGLKLLPRSEAVSSHRSFSPLQRTYHGVVIVEACVPDSLLLSRDLQPLVGDNLVDASYHHQLS